MAGHYEGSATIVLDGAEIPVDATMSVHGTAALPSWGGVLRADPDAADLWAVHEAEQPVVRLPNGREGNFLLRADANLTTGMLTISGSGNPPF
jgi:hypothetical protein